MSILYPSKKQAACGFETKSGVLGAKLSALKSIRFSEFVNHKYTPQMVLPPYLYKRFLPILRTKTYTILFRKNSSYGTMIPTLSLEWLQVPNRQVTLEKTLRKHLFKAGKTLSLRQLSA